MNIIDNQTLESLNLAPRSEAKKDRLAQTEFLKLMTTQLNNQDPLKPMQSGEFFTQIAQFSSVAGIQELQDSFQQVATAMFSSQALQASAMVGRSVVVPGAAAALKAGATVEGAAELGASTPGLTVYIEDGVGQRVRRIDLGPQAAGVVRFAWDGRTDSGTQAPPGTYQLRAEAVVDGAPLAVGTLVAARVESVTMGSRGQGIKLNLDGLGAVDLARVKQVM